MSELDHFSTMRHYEAWAAERTLASIAASPPDAPETARARGIFAHIQKARQMWLFRLGAGEKPVWEMFPDWPIDRLRQEAHATDTAWGKYLEALTEAELRREVAYASTEGRGFVSTVGEILAHVFNHSTYHRGQIAMLVAKAGGPPASTDLIVFSRRATP